MDPLGLRLLLLLLLWLGVFVRLVRAATPDSGFRLDLQPGESAPDLLAPANDGSVYVAVAGPSDQGVSGTSILRILADGTRDAGFRAFFPRNEGVRNLTCDGAGTVYLAVEQGLNTSRYKILRLKSDGSPDERFDVGLRVAPCTLSGADRGGVWVSGETGEEAGNVVFRLTEAGVRDPAFDGREVAGDLCALAVVELPDPAILVTGQFLTVGGVERFGLAILRPQGRVDEAFVPDYVEWVEEGPPVIQAVLRQPDGRWIVAGMIRKIGDHRTSGVGRLLPNGKVDTSFRVAGMEGEGDGPSVDQVFLDPLGGIIIRGSFRRVNGLARPGLARLGSDGRLDGAFYPLDPGQETLRGFALDHRGRMILSVVRNDSGRFSSQIVRMPVPVAQPAPPEVVQHPAGGLRRVGGRIALEVHFRSTSPAGLQWLHNGVPLPGATNSDLILEGLHLNQAGSYSVEIVNAHGRAKSRAAYVAIEPTLASAGWPDLRFDPGEGPDKTVVALHVRSDARLVVGGHFGSFAGVPAGGLVVVDPEGRADPVVSARCRTDGLVWTLAGLPGDAILVGGKFRRVGTSSAASLARLLPDGSPDPGFHAEVPPDFVVHQVVPLADGGLYALITESKALIPRSYLRRLRVDGSADTTYAPAIDPLVCELRAAPMPDGSLLLCGRIPPDTGSRLYRVRPDGGIDPALAGRPLPSGSVFALAPRSDGTLWIGGSFAPSSPPTRTRVPDLRILGPQAEFLPTPTDRDFPRLTTVDLVVPDRSGRWLVGNANRLSRLQPNGSVERLLLSRFESGRLFAVAEDAQGDLYLGGSFSSVMGVRRRCLARVYGEDRTQPHLLGPFLSDGVFEFALETHEGWKYQLEAGASLDDGTWEPVLAITGDGRRQVFRDPESRQSNRFFRIQVRP